MYIKQIIIQGFKSYKEQTVIEPFSPKHNVIVGRNGSGKSNFFAAIRFVLSDAYTQMGREERQALLHEGSGSAVVSAYVEVIFDNTDERFPTGKDELILRRTIGLKKDEYSLDRKNATKADVMSLLESAGFSRSNPYYIVPQGRVTTLTNMKDSERLSLLKEVAGTQVYEARRLESLKIMTDTVNKRKKIDELLDYIKERLAELEEEKEDLRGFQEKDRERRCLEYTIYHREQVEIANALDGIDGMRQTGVDDTDGSREKFLRGEKDIQAIEREIQSLRQQVDFLKVDKQQLEEERRENAKARAKVELDVTALSEGQSQSARAKSQHDNELKAVQAKISQRERELQTIRPQFDAKREQEVAIRTRLEDADALRHRLYAKQGRSARFKTQNERDNWLRKEISDANVALATRKAIRMQTTEEIAGLQEEIQTMTAKIEELRVKFDNRGDSMSNIAEEVQAIKDKRDALMDERKELWREEAKLDSVIETARQELERAERVLSHTMDQNTSRGLDAVRRIAKQQKLEGVYGTLAEVIDVNERYRTAVEVAAGQSLFHYVVDNDETATKVLEILQKERAGRVTFMPLNRLKPRPINVPKTGDAVPMLEKIKFDEKYQKAVEQVFGKTIICPNLQVAAQYARSHGVSAITPDGDRSDKKGALTGGYHDPRKSRLEAVRSVAKWRTEYEDLKEKTWGVRKGVEKKDQEITREVGELQKVEQRKQRVEGSYGPLRNELRASVSLLEKYRDDLEAKIRAKDNVEASLKLLEEQLSAFEAELASDLQKMLSKDEERQLEQLSASAQDFRRQYAELSSSRSELEVQKSMIEVELRENLRQRLDQLKNQEFENLEEGSGSASHRLRESQRELKRIGQTVATIQKKLQETEEAMENTNRKLTELEQGRSEKYQDQEDVAQSIERQQKKMEKSMAKKALLTEKAAECSRNIRDLGVLPEEAFDRFEKMASNNIVKRLHTVLASLKQYSHVNKKAFEQYANFTKQRDTLNKRRGELDLSESSIEELIEVLDQRKDEAIERTFKQVSKEFSDVFEKLVPAGRGRLVIQRKTDQKVVDNEDNEDDEDEEDEKNVENYTGVGISVSFNSKHDEQQRIQQLSGGQKSLCALALVFAIQQCDPAPFYLFDEIDANLDAQYRTAVAGMLKSIAEKGSTGDEAGGGGQFICTTFRPEMVLVADKCYGVAYAGKTSSIDVVKREEALEFVEGQKV